MIRKLMPPFPSRWICALLMASAHVAAATTLRVMTFNLWHGGDAGGQPLEQSAEVIRASRADVVGLQETRGHAIDGQRPDHGARLAEILGWHYHNQGGSPGVLSRWPIIAHTPGGHGVTLQHPDGPEFHVFNVHLPHAPYQPYQLLGIPYHDAPFLTTADEAVDAARRARGRHSARLIAEMRAAIADDRPVFLTGDFNEPSHLDWTARASAAGLCPLVVAYPTTLTITAAGMTDAYRAVHPDEVARPGWTWTPITRPDDPADRHDRIDMIFFAGPRVSVTTCQVVGESEEFADIVVAPFPSDHRAVVAGFTLDGTAASEGPPVSRR